MGNVHNRFPSHASRRLKHGTIIFQQLLEFSFRRVAEYEGSSRIFGRRSRVSSGWWGVIYYVLLAQTGIRYAVKILQTTLLFCSEKKVFANKPGVLMVVKNKIND